MHRKHPAGRQLDVLPKLQVAQHENALALEVLAIQRAVHIRDQIPRDTVDGTHLVGVVHGCAEVRPLCVRDGHC